MTHTIDLKTLDGYITESLLARSAGNGSNKTLTMNTEIFSENDHTETYFEVVNKNKVVYSGKQLHLAVSVYNSLP